MIRNISKTYLQDVCVGRVAKIVQIGINIAVRHVCCQIPDLILANTVRRVYRYSVKDL